MEEGATLVVTDYDREFCQVYLKKLGIREVKDPENTEEGISPFGIKTFVEIVTGQFDQDMEEASLLAYLNELPNIIADVTKEYYADRPNSAYESAHVAVRQLCEHRVRMKRRRLL